MNKLLFAALLLLSASTSAQAASWYVRGEHNECMPIEKVATLKPVSPLGLGGVGIDSPDSLAAALRAKGIESVLSPIRPGNAKIIEIRAPGGTFWLVLAGRDDCRRFVDRFQ